MRIFWDGIVEPAIVALRARVIVEIGSEGGENTNALLAYCGRYDAVLHVIDPRPRFDVRAWQQRHGSRFVVHATLSLQALSTIDAIDVVLIDGDHNWYTVVNELRFLDRQCARAGRPFPLILLHDIGWPYGRRDMYYDPATIPDAFRQPCAMMGIRWNESGLAANGVNPHLWNATAENTPRNGVLTAVEDFLKETEQSLRLIQIPGFFGLGILFRERLPNENEAFARFLATWDLPDSIRAYVTMLEHNRVQLLTTAMELWTANQK